MRVVTAETKQSALSEEEMESVTAAWEGWDDHHRDIRWVWSIRPHLSVRQDLKRHVAEYERLKDTWNGTERDRYEIDEARRWVADVACEVVKHPIYSAVPRWILIYFKIFTNP